MKPISECTVLITGATDGLGKITAERFAEKGATVLLHGRSPEKGQRVLEEIKEATGNQSLRYYNGDFSSLKSVAQLADEIISDGVQLDILINNAGLGGGSKTKKERETSEDGFELRWAVNYLAQVLLTRKLLPVLAPNARIINVASGAQAAIDFDDLNMENHYSGYLAYSRSKLALVMFTFDLAAELKEKDIQVNTLHPASLMNTNMVLEHFGHSTSTLEDGYAALEYVTNLEDVTGEYYNQTQRSKAHNQAYDPQAHQQLKQATQESLTPYI